MLVIVVITLIRLQVVKFVDQINSQSTVANAKIVHLVLSHLLVLAHVSHAHLVLDLLVELANYVHLALSLLLVQLALIVHLAQLLYLQVQSIVSTAHADIRVLVILVLRAILVNSQPMVRLVQTVQLAQYLLEPHALV
jgi:hypothetical protein